VRREGEKWVEGFSNRAWKVVFFNGKKWLEVSKLYIMIGVMNSVE
jgi:hypothetical protein